MDENINSDFMKQFSGSATANLAFGLLFLLYQSFKKLCDRKSKCKSRIHCCCLDLDIKDETIREPPVVVGEEDHII
jgi:hypothetical protein